MGGDSGQKDSRSRHAGSVYCSPPTPLLAAAHTWGTWVLRPPTPLQLRHCAHGCAVLPPHPALRLRQAARGRCRSAPPAAAAARTWGVWVLPQPDPPPPRGPPPHPHGWRCLTQSLAHRPLPTVSSSCSTWLSALRQRGPGGVGEWRQLPLRAGRRRWRQLQAAAAAGRRQASNTDALGRGRRSVTP